MRKYLLSYTCIIMGFTSLAQLPVTHVGETRKVVLEEFTGIHCYYCPDGHFRANAMKTANPDKVFLINVHTGGYAVPNAGEPDFRTSFGTALANQSNLSGYPSGTVNRHVFSGTNTALSRTAWASKATEIFVQSSYANVAFEATLDVTTRLLTVDVEVYFALVDAPDSVNFNLVMTQDSIEGPQTGGSVLNPGAILPNGKYLHNHMLRHMITGQWGDVITNTAQTTTFSKTYTYTIPDAIGDIDVKLSNIHLVAFVAEGHQEIITGSTGPIQFVDFLSDNNVDHDLATDLVVSPNPANTSLNVQFNLNNSSSSKIEIYNAAGILVYNQAEGLQKGLNDISINTSELSNGIYFLAISNNKKTTTKKISIVK